MTPDEILNAFDNIRVWQRGDRRAAHKPLLILMALGSLARGEKPRAEFAEIEGKLGRPPTAIRRSAKRSCSPTNTAAASAGMACGSSTSQSPSRPRT